MLVSPSQSSISLITPSVPEVLRIANELINLADDADGMLADLARLRRNVQRRGNG
jgi:hypothetical protein